MPQTPHQRAETELTALGLTFPETVAPKKLGADDGVRGPDRRLPTGIFTRGQVLNKEAGEADGPKLNRSYHFSPNKLPVAGALLGGFLPNRS